MKTNNPATWGLYGCVHGGGSYPDVVTVWALDGNPPSVTLFKLERGVIICGAYEVDKILYHVGCHTLVLKRPCVCSYEILDG